MLGLLLALLLGPPAFAQRPGEVGFTIQDWGGLNTNRDSARIGDTEAQESINVLTDAGRLEQRPGSELLTTFSGALENVAEFIDPPSTRYLIGQSSGIIYQTSLGAAPVFLTTVTFGNRVDFTVAYSSVIIVDGVRAIAWDATSSTTVSGFPGFELVEFYQGRVWGANQPSESGSQVRISSNGGITYWTVHPDPTVEPEGPNLFYFSRDDGLEITCLARTPWGMFVGKKPRGSFIVKGLDNTNWYIRTVDPNIGCVDDRSVQMVNGRLQWLAADGVYSWNGADAPRWESEDIDPTVKSLRQINAQAASIVLDSEADWASGIATISGPGAPLSTIRVSGSVTSSTWTDLSTSSGDFSGGVFSQTTFYHLPELRLLASTSREVLLDDFEDESLSEWTQIGVWSSGSSAPSGGGKLACRVGDIANGIAATDANGMRLTADLNNPPAGRWGIKFRVNSAFTSGQAVFRYKFIHDTSSGDGYALETSDLSTLRLVRKQAGSETLVGSYTGINFNAVVGTHTFTITRSTAGEFQVAYNSVDVITGTDAAVWLTTYTALVSVQTSDPGQGCNDPVVGVDSVTFSRYVDSGVAFGEIFNTSFSTPVGGPLQVSSTVPNGTTLKYLIRSGTTATPDATWSAWSAINDSAVSTQTSRYWQTASSFTTTVSTVSPSIQAITLNATTSGYYHAPVRFIGSNITSYGTLDITQIVPSGSTNSFSVRAATYAFPGDNSALVWTAQGANETISLTISTPVYFQWRGLLNPLEGGKETQILLARTNWNEGDDIPMASAVKDRRYILCVALSSTSIRNDTCLVQQRNAKWVTFAGWPMAALTIFNNDLIGASGATDGEVWQLMQEGALNDDGAVISSTWTSKDFMFAPNGLDWAVGEKILNEVWVDAEVSSGVIVTVGYAVNKSTTFATGTINLGAFGDSVNRRIPFNDSFALGKYFRFRFEHAQLDKTFKFNAYSIYGEPKPRTQD